MFLKSSKVGNKFFKLVTKTKPSKYNGNLKQT